MSYDPTGFYPMGYDHRGMPISMHSGGYDVPMDMYLLPPTSSTSSRSRNPTDVNSNFWNNKIDIVLFDLVWTRDKCISSSYNNIKSLSTKW